MSIAKITYKWLLGLFLVLILAGCGAEMEDHDKESADAAKGVSPASEEGVAETENGEEAEVSMQESAKKDLGPSVDKWRSKAQQQIESMGDLLLILKDTDLDPAFKAEITKELSQLYSNQDSMLNRWMTNPIEFNDFGSLKHESGDTMSLVFKNDTEVYKAKFAVVSEAKDFGGSIEVIDQLKIISIDEEK